MAKQTSPAAGTVARHNNRKPSPVVQVSPAPAPVEQPATANAVVDEMLAPAPAPAQAAAPAAPAPAPAPAAPVQAAAVALRGGLAVVAVAPGKPYRVQAGHNLGWLQQVQAAWAAGGQVASVQGLLAAGVPAPFIGYMVRRGYAVQVAAPTTTN